MSPRRARPKLRSAGKSAGVEWIGGVISFPAYITGEGEPFRPQLLVWIGADGAVVGKGTARPDDDVPRALSECLQSAIDEPMSGRPHRPTRVRVASAELADVVRAEHPDIDVLCAPTPEVDDLLTFMQERIEGEVEQSYLSPEVSPDAVASFFKATAALFRAEPWNVVPDDTSLFSVTVEQLGIRDHILSVIGQMGESFGLVLFADIEDFESFVISVDVAAEIGTEPIGMPPHFALNFERGADLAPAVRKEIGEHHWEVAAANAYPWAYAIDEELVARPPTAKELVLVEAVALALTEMLDEKEALEAAWESREPMTRTLSVTTHQGKLDVTLSTPYVRLPFELDPSYDIIADLIAVSHSDDPVDLEAREALEQELMRRFAVSPEAKDVKDGIGACDLLMEYAESYLGETIATLPATGLHEILFEVFPRKVGVEASAARSIVEELRAFYLFLKREYDLEDADACLRVLGGDAVEELEAALSDSRKFGLAKTLVMTAARAGLDVDSEEGLDAFVKAIQGQRLQPAILSSGAGAPRPASKKAAKAKKTKRKAARKARKKNK